MKPTAVFIFGLLLVATSPALAKKPSGKGPCKHGTQCAQGVCIEINGDSYCSQTCGGCPAGMFCDDELFKMMNLKVCVKGSAEQPPKPKAPPRVPCKTDKQCPGALICAQMMGQRDCTIPCKTQAQCEMPEMMGVKMDFMGCRLDQGKRGRKACLPKKKCIANPASCMSVDPSAMGDMMGMAGAMVPQTQPPAAHQPAASTPTETPPAAEAMPDGRFKKFLAQVKAASFEDERNAVIDTAAKRNHFECEQVGQVLAEISFGDEKISALRLLAPKIVDKENSHTILAQFSFDDEKNQARNILNQ